MNKREFNKFETIVNSYWDSLPKEMQKELIKFYEKKDQQKIFLDCVFILYIIKVLTIYKGVKNGFRFIRT